MDLEERIYEVVLSIPPGKVLTYGDVARLAGAPRAARKVGSTLARLPPGSEVPWHRVVNAAGGISTGGTEQRSRLQAEGLLFSPSGRLDLARARYEPGAR